MFQKYPNLDENYGNCKHVLDTIFTFLWTANKSRASTTTATLSVVPDHRAGDYIWDNPDGST